MIFHCDQIELPITSLIPTVPRPIQSYLPQNAEIREKEKNNDMPKMTPLPFVQIVVLVVIGLACRNVDGFTFNSPRLITISSTVKNDSSSSNNGKSQLFFVRQSSVAEDPQQSRRAKISSTTLLTASSAAANNDDVSAKKEETTSTTATSSNTSKKKAWKELRMEGGPLTINTPIGALNPYALYYFFVSVALGIPWVILCKCCQFMYWITGNRFDPERRVPIFIGHCWGMALMRLTRCYPEIKNRELVIDFFKKKKENGKEQNAMFVANHCSWMDIPFLGATMGWRNYKIVSKKELGAVPILGTAIRAGGHIMVDRVDRRSQVRTLKQGIGYLKDGLNLATFPEGTRSRSSRMMEFKAGAFKMAHKAGAPVFPISIVNSDKVMPAGWMMAMRPAYGMAQVIVHPPISSDDKTEEELVEAVRKSMIDGLPDDQKPLR